MEFSEDEIKKWNEHANKIDETNKYFEDLLGIKLRKPTRYEELKKQSEEIYNKKYKKEVERLNKELEELLNN